MREAFACPVGLSDHSGTIFPGLAGATLGIDVLEVHVTFHKGQFGPDVPASLTFEALKLMIEGIRFIELMRATPVDKASEAEAAAPLRQMFMKGLVVTRDIAAGETFAPGDLDARKPQAGVAVARYDDIVGRKAARAIRCGAFLQEEDLVDAKRTG
jgi:N-acetylneuraminate synthase